MTRAPGRRLRGAGYYGGGGGYQYTYCGGGGGGGSSYAVDANAVLEAGVWAVPGGQGAPGYVEGTGVGGPTGEPGGSGYAIVQFEQ